MCVYGPDGHQLALEGRYVVTHIRRGPAWKGDASYVHFGRTCGNVTSHCTQHGNILWDSFRASDEVARRLVRYALRRGWQVTECTADHPLRDILPDGWGAP